MSGPDTLTNVSPGVTRAESCVIACADAWRGAGEIMASPFGTIPSLGARVAKLTFAPELVLTDGEAALMVGAPPLATRTRRRVISKHSASLKKTGMRRSSFTPSGPQRGSSRRHIPDDA